MTSSFFSGQTAPPEVNTTDALIDELTAQVALVTTANTQAQAAATAAEASASNASISETNVSTLSQQANDTLAQANNAVAQANTTLTQANTDATNAANSATQASSSASAAATSATNASTSATNASNSASAASASQTAAASSASAAATSQTAAAGSASAAAASASNASSSATGAATSATNAASSASSASTSASTATTQASNASSSATAAASSASAASTSASNASSSATAAANSATAAANSAASIALPLPISSGGTGQTTAAAALTALGTQPTNNPSFTGNVGVPTRTVGDSSPNAANTAFVSTAVAPFSGKNRIINGGMSVNQRGTFQSSGAYASYGGPDRFISSIANGAGGAISVAGGNLIATPEGYSTLSIRQTVTTAFAGPFTGAMDWFGITQSIEGINCYDLIGRQVSISFVFNTNVSGTYSVALSDGNVAVTPANAKTYVTTFTATAGVPQRVKIVLPAIPSGALIPAGPAVGLRLCIGAIAGPTSYTSTLNSWITGNLFSASTSTLWCTAVGNFIEVGELQLEAGNTCTPFDRRSYTHELQLCQRYFYRYASSSTAADVAVGLINSGTNILADIVFPSTMRAVPTLGSSNLYGSSATQLVAGSASSISNASTQAVRLNLTCSGATWTVGQAGIVIAGSGAGGWIQFDAEL